MSSKQCRPLHWRPVQISVPILPPPAQYCVKLLEIEATIGIELNEVKTFQQSGYRFCIRQNETYWNWTQNLSVAGIRIELKLGAFHS